MTTGKTVTLFNDRTAQPLASGATLVYKARFVDENGDPIAASQFSSLVLSIIDTKTGAIINTVDDEDILNTDRGTVDSEGKLVVILLPADTTITTGKSADRSLVLTWTYGVEDHVGRHQVDFKILALSGDI